MVPAAFTLATGKDHWHVLLRARAIESQAYVIAAAQWGAHPRGRRTYGKSLVADPWGDVIAQHGEGEGFVAATLSRSYVDGVRANLPSLRARRLESDNTVLVCDIEGHISPIQLARSSDAGLTAELTAPAPVESRPNAVATNGGIR